MASFDPAQFKCMPLIAILRGQRLIDVPPIVNALASGGFYAVEITMNSPSAAEQIRTAIEIGPEHIRIGAGTVTTMEELDVAHQAGSTFIVTPVVVPEIIKECVHRKLPIFPGAFTPSEIHTAHQLGATMVKLFPAHQLGPDYIRDLKAPLSAIPILATGGITPENIPDYIRAGADGFGIGSPLMAKEFIAGQDWDRLRKRAAQFCAVWSSASD